MGKDKSYLWAIASLAAIVLGGVLAVLIRWEQVPDQLAILAFVSVLIVGMGLSKPRQPHAELYQPRGFATRLLKWVSAPQVEAAILWWFGLSILVEPMLVVSSTRLDLAIGWLFLLLGWLLVAYLPNPVQFTLIVGTRLGFTLLLVVDAFQLEASPLVLGAYLGSILYGILTMLLHWTLREVADLVVCLRQEVQRLSG